MACSIDVVSPPTEPTYMGEVRTDVGELRSDLDITSPRQAPRLFNEQTVYYRFDYPHAPTESPSATEPEPGDIQTGVLCRGRCVTLLCLSCAYRLLCRATTPPPPPSVYLQATSSVLSCLFFRDYTTHYYLQGYTPTPPSNLFCANGLSHTRPA